MQNNETMSSPEIPSYFLPPEDKSRWSELVAGDTPYLASDDYLNNDLGHERPGIGPSSSRCSRNQPHSAIDPSTYQPNALYRHAGSPLFDPPFSVPEFPLALYNGMLLPVAT
jgi:hypothetical protein